MHILNTFCLISLRNPDKFTGRVNRSCLFSPQLDSLVRFRSYSIKEFTEGKLYSHQVKNKFLRNNRLKGLSRVNWVTSSTRT